MKFIVWCYCCKKNVNQNCNATISFQKTPFAETNAKSELGKFYREWQTAPPLQTFSDLPTLAEQVQDLAQQLETFESNIPEYDDVLQSLCQSPNNN